VGDQAVEFGPQAGPLGRVGGALFVAPQAHFLGQGVELGRGADQPRRALDDRPERRLISRSGWSAGIRSSTLKV
jgi:hypothetical protein